MSKRGRLDFDDVKAFGKNTAPLVASMAVEVLSTGAVTWKGFVAGMGLNLLRHFAENKPKENANAPKSAPTD